MQPIPSSQLGIDDFENVELIGSGGSAQVYRATQVSFERDVAVKILSHTDEQLNRRFDRERRAMGKLSNHAGIVPVYTSGTTSFDQPYLVMPFYARGSLADQIKSGPMPWQEAVDHLTLVASTIGHAHDNGVLHLDLKPGNVMVADDGTPRVADFGIAKLLTDQTSRSATNTSFTPAYCPPEILNGEAPNTAADIYGLGATLWALVAGRPPFQADETSANSIVAVMGRVAHEPPGDLRDRAPEWVCRIIERAMAKDPAARFSTGQEMAAALEAGEAGQTASQATVAVPPQGWAPTPTPTPASQQSPSQPLSTAHTQPVGPPIHDPATLTPPAAVEAPTGFTAPTPAAFAGPTTAAGTTSPKGPLVLGAIAVVVIVGLVAAFALFRGNGADTVAAASDDSAATSDALDSSDGNDTSSSTTAPAETETSDAAATDVTPTTAEAPSTAEVSVTDPPTTQPPSSETTTGPSSSVPPEELSGTSLAGRHGITLQWISFDSPDWGAIEFEPLGDERYEVSGRQDGPDGDYVIVEGTMTKISDLELQFEGTVEVRVSYLADGQPCLREGQMTFLSTQNRQYWRMQNFQSPCDTQADYVDIYF